jgi:hypothetical protein
MGNYNSGRRPEMWDPRGQVEDAVVLEAGLLRQYGAFVRGAAGILRWEGSSASFRCDGERLTLNYRTRGQEYCQHIRISEVSLKWSQRRSTRPALLCDCGYRGYKLYLSKRQPYFLCRTCQGLIYELQTYNSSGLCYALLKSIKEERRIRYAWQKHDKKRKRDTVLDTDRTLSTNRPVDSGHPPGGVTSMKGGS